MPPKMSHPPLNWPVGSVKAQKRLFSPEIRLRADRLPPGHKQNPAGQPYRLLVTGGQSGVTGEAPVNKEA
jgi:hypothetical protein